jgi:glycosyltransferase involved in cell wall biosynthesis
MVDEKNEQINILPFKISGWVARVYLRLFRSLFVKRHIDPTDIVDIHFVEPYYSKYLCGLPNKLICTIFGSDLFRTSDKQKKMQKAIFEKANKIVLAENMRDYFVSHFEGMEAKLYYTQYGSEILEKIVLLKSNLSIPVIRKKYNVEGAKMVVSCGYNRIKEQQHLKIIDELTKLDVGIKNKIHLLFLLTNGNATNEYLEEIERRLKQSAISYTCIHNKVTEIEIAELRILTDIAINMQTTDALASSIKEEFAAGTIVMVGDWLPYKIYENLGIHYYEINFQTINDRFVFVIENFDQIKKMVKKNEDIVLNFASWSSLINKWVDLYNTV